MQRALVYGPCPSCGEFVAAKADPNDAIRVEAAIDACRVAIREVHKTCDKARMPGPDWRDLPCLGLEPDTEDAVAIGVRRHSAGEPTPA